MGLVFVECQPANDGSTLYSMGQALFGSGLVVVLNHIVSFIPTFTLLFAEAVLSVSLAPPPI